MESFRFCHQLRVRYSEIDGQKIVFNANYLSYYDDAIDEYFKNVLGHYWAEPIDGVEPVLVRSEVDYKSPARLHDLLNVYCKIISLGKTSLEVEFRLTRANDEQILSVARHVYVMYNLESGKSSLIPAGVMAKLREFEGI